ncbi:unnamed protein product, partial [Allacma fusca]
RSMITVIVSFGYLNTACHVKQLGRTTDDKQYEESSLNNMILQK